MIVTIRVPAQVVKTLLEFGTLESVVDAILHEWEAGNYQIYGLDSIGSNLSHLTQRKINVKNVRFIELLKTQANNSQIVSLSRILFDVVSNERFDTFGWKLGQFADPASAPAAQYYLNQILEWFDIGRKYICNGRLPDYDAARAVIVDILRNPHNQYVITDKENSDEHTCKVQS